MQHDVGGAILYSSKIAILVPTIFQRPLLLVEALRSIRNAGDCHLAISFPDLNEHWETFRSLGLGELVDQVISQPEVGSLGFKIDAGLRAIPEEFEVIGWLGDDDLLKPGLLMQVRRIFSSDTSTVLAFGACEYIDHDGARIGINPAPAFSPWIMTWGPQLLPQPGSFWRRDAFLSVGGLSHDYEQAFDLDFFLKIRKIGKMRRMDGLVSSFRWHSGSMSVNNRFRSVKEAETVRAKHSPELIAFLRKTGLASLLKASIFHAGSLVTTIGKVQRRLNMGLRRGSK